MPKINRYVCLLAIFLPMSAGAQTQDGGRIYASQCFQCHGTNGHSVADIDSIAGKSAKEIVETLTDMRKKTGTDNIMHQQAKGYTDQQIRELAAYLATVNGSRAAGSQ